MLPMAEARGILASQLGEELDARLRDSGYAVVDLPRGAPAFLPAEVEILAVTPFEWRGAARPVGWPWNVRWIHLASAGIDSYPDWLFDVSLVTASAGVTAGPVAEFALAAIFAAAKNIPDCWIDDADRWTWRQSKSIAGSTLSILGYGPIGQRIAKAGIALGMTVLVARRTPNAVGVSGVEFVAGIEDLLARSDHLVLAAPATPDTHHILNGKSLSSARPGIHIVNVARGSLIDQEALLVAVDNGPVGLATLDVTDPEPLEPGHAFYTHPRIRLSPHISFLTPELGASLLSYFIANLERFHTGESLHGVVKRVAATEGADA